MDFKIRNEITNEYVSSKMVRNIFPPNPITNQWIDFVRLQPKIGEDIDGEELNMSCKISIHTAKEDAMFNVVGTCAYGNTPDPVRIKDEWNKREAELKKSRNTNGANLDLDSVKIDWMILDAQRYFIENSFDFIVETVGVYENIYIVKMSCSILVRRLEELIRKIRDNELNFYINPDSTMKYPYDIILDNIDYTIGKALEYIMYTNYYKNKRELVYCGFIKKHPHDTYSILRIAFHDDSMGQGNAAAPTLTVGGSNNNYNNSNNYSGETNENSHPHRVSYDGPHGAKVVQYLEEACTELVTIYQTIQSKMEYALTTTTVDIDYGTEETKE